jgi:hypothetical protein
VSKGGNQTIGYKYHMDLHMGLCRGPVDEIVDIRVGDQGINGPVPWSVDASANFVEKPDLFGGDEKEGGIAGRLWVFTGHAAQGVYSFIKDALGGLVSDWRGVATVYYSGVVATNNPYPKAWAFRVRRALEGWDGGTAWYAAKARISMAEGAISAMNPAHIIYECLTNRDWGRGLPSSAIDEESFNDCANRLCDEGFGLCLKWTRKGDIDEFVNSVIQHIAGALYADRSTGLWVLRLIRDDYVASSLPVFDYDSGLLSVEEDESGARDTAINELVVTYFDPLIKGERQVRVQDSAAFAAHGAIYSSSQQYPGIPTGDLAARVAQRDLTAQATQLRRFKLVCDRRAWNIAPGAVLKISVPSRGIDDMVVRVGKFEDSTLVDGRITLHVVQDVFSTPLTSYVGVVDSAWSPPEQMTVPDTRLLSEATYQDRATAVGSNNVSQFDEAASNVVVQIKRPVSTAVDYTIYSAADATPTQETGSGNFTPVSITAADMAASGGAVVPVGSLPVSGDWVTLDTATLPRQSMVLVGTAARIVSSAGEEIVQVYAWEDYDTGVLTVKRGCADTVPKAHPAGAQVWFYGSSFGTDHVEYQTGEAVSVAVVPRTQTSSIALADAPIDSIEIDERSFRPYPPQVHHTWGAAALGWTTPGDFPYFVRWVSRNRLTQADQLVGSAEPTVTPEDGTTYNLRLYNNESDLLLAEDLGIAPGTHTEVSTNPGENDWSYNSSSWVSHGSPAQVRVEIEAVRGGLTSRDRWVGVIQAA